MAISFLGSNSAGNTNGSNTSISLTSGGLGATLVQNDIVVVFGGHTRLGDPVGTSDSGWITIQEEDTLGSEHVIALYKIMGASPDTSVTVLGSGNSADACAYVAFAFRGVDTSDPIDAASSTVATGNSTNPNPASIATVTNNAYALAFALSESDDSAITAPSGYSGLESVNRSDTSPATAAGCYKAIPTAGLENPASFTDWSTGQWATITTALKPFGSITDGAFSGGSIRGTASFVGTTAATVIARAAAFTGTVTASFEGNSISQQPAPFTMTATATVQFEIIGGFEGNIEIAHTWRASFVGDKELMSSVREVVEERGFMSVTVH